MIISPEILAGPARLGSTTYSQLERYEHEFNSSGKH